MGIREETRAYAALAELLKKVDEVTALFRQSGIPEPEVLARFRDEQQVDTRRKSAEPSMKLTDPQVPAEAPDGFADDWIWIPVGKLSVQCLVRGILRAEKNPVPVKSIISRCQRINPGQNEGSVQNIGTQLQRSGAIERSEQGWTLVDVEGSPVLSESYAWGPASVFGKYELAAHRRDGIRHVLAAFKAHGGLQAMQILANLQSLKWLRAPIGKDLVKVDLDVMFKAGEIKRAGNSKKYVLTEGGAK